jgi:membrane-bound serine protease (ClpP class)
MKRLPLLFPAVLVAAVAIVPALAGARAPRRVEVVEITGIIDSPAEHAIDGTLKDANREKAQLVVIQLNSRGAVGADRGSNVIDRISASRVPVAVWIPPDGVAANSAAFLAIGAGYTSMAGGSRLGPVKTDDLSSKSGERSVAALRQFARGSRRVVPFDRSIGPRTAIRDHVADGMAQSVTDVLQQLDGKTLNVGDKSVKLSVDPDTTEIRLRKLGIVGGALHAAAKPSIVYLLLLVGIVGVVFELFHPSTGPAGAAGLLAIALAIYGMLALHGSWAGFAVICFGVAAFCIDLASDHLGPLTVIGFLLLTGGSIFLFPGPYLRVSPVIIAFGVIAMTMFLLGAMTRVLRDLRAIARGDLEVRDPHPHPNGQES